MNVHEGVYEAGGIAIGSGHAQATGGAHGSDLKRSIAWSTSRIAHDIEAILVQSFVAKPHGAGRAEPGDGPERASDIGTGIALQVAGALEMCIRDR